MKKRKVKVEAEAFSACIAAWVIKLHSDCVLTKIDLGMQKVVEEVA